MNSPQVIGRKKWIYSDEWNGQEGRKELSIHRCIVGNKELAWEGIDDRKMKGLDEGVVELKTEAFIVICIEIEFNLMIIFNSDLNV